MLRRNFSFPMGVDQLSPTSGLFNAARSRSMCDLAMKQDRRATSPALDETETVWRNWFLTRPEAACWEKSVVSPVSSSSNLGLSAEHLGSYDEEKQENEDKYEEQRTINSSDLNLKEKNKFIAELVHSQNCLKTLNADLQKSLEMSDDCNMSLIAENTDLKNQIKGMKQTIQDAQQVSEELDNLQPEKLETERLLSASEAKCKQLEKQNKTLQEDMAVLSSETSSILSENEMYERKFVELSKLLKALQQQVEEYRLHLKQNGELIDQRVFVIQQLECSVTESSTIIQDLKEKIKGLEEQVSWAVVNGGEGSFMYFDGTLSAATQRSLSLAKELGLLPGGQMECHKGEKEDQLYEKEDGSENEKIKKELKTEKKGSLRWLSSGNLKRGLSAAGVMGLTCTAPLGALIVLIYTCEGAGPSCAGLICNTVEELIKPYCNLHHLFPPPV
ncbi:uncharacterized protein LOC143518219 isoform X2 [Brachyhypopomus gauderio]|uniref:uncharacterized protein LOC143518219 isoform X2 n=1 Tax=Brachyhypopomus gauderio TaxID=698409 RepID=UPI004042D111